MQKRVLALATTLAVVLGSAGCALAQDSALPNTTAAQGQSDHRTNEATAAMSGYNGSKSAEPNPDLQLTQKEKKFLEVAAQDGKDQVEIGKVIEQKSHDNALKRFAQRLVQDHDQINKELRSLAEKENYEIPNQVDAEGVELQARLEELSGSELNRTYLRTVIEQRANALQEFEIASQDSTHTAVKRFASKTLPVLKSQLREAKWLASKEGVNLNQPVGSTQK